MSVQPRSSLTGRHRLPLLLIVLTFVVLTALAVHARGWLATQPAAASPAKSLRAPQTGSALEVELITVTSHGFDPAEIARPAGRFILMLNNQSGQQGVTFRLDQEGGSRVREIALSLEQTEWSEAVDLQPGAYLLTEANHPDWLARIMINGP